MKKTWRYKIRALTVEGDVAYVPLTRGLSAIIDASDAYLAEGWNWCAMPAEGGGWYAYCAGKRKIRLHQIILTAPAGFTIDHKDRNGLNCRRENLRIANFQENARNRKHRIDGISKFKGVSPHGPNWRARIQIGASRLALGTFTSEETAANAYDSAAIKHFGEFAVLNFPYKGNDDFNKSINDCYRAIRDRQANGGPGWIPKEAAE